MIQVSAYSCPLCSGPADCPIGHMYLCRTPGCKNGPKDVITKRDIEAVREADNWPVSMVWMYVIPQHGYPVPVTEDRDTDIHKQVVRPIHNGFYFDASVPPDYETYEVFKTPRGPHRAKVGSHGGIWSCKGYERVEVKHTDKLILLWRRDP